MTNSLVLNEALSIPSVIGKFAFSDKNPYQEIAYLINHKKIKYVLGDLTNSSFVNEI